MIIYVIYLYKERSDNCSVHINRIMTWHVFHKSSNIRCSAVHSTYDGVQQSNDWRRLITVLAYCCRLKLVSTGIIFNTQCISTSLYSVCAESCNTELRSLNSPEGVSKLTLFYVFFYFEQLMIRCNVPDHYKQVISGGAEGLSDTPLLLSVYCGTSGSHLRLHGNSTTSVARPTPITMTTTCTIRLR